MKNLNKRLSEAIDRGINIALDDYENDVNDMQLSTKSSIVKNHSSVTMRILIQNFLESKNYKLKREKIYKDILDLVNNEGYTYTPKDRNELINLINVILKIDMKANLNWLDVSRITNMSWLFHDTCFEGDISKWDVSHVEDFTLMFSYSKFTGDISNWNVSSVTSMSGMFTNSIFNGDLSKWNVKNVKSFALMFNDSKFNNESIINWNIGEGVDMNSMFANSSMSVARLTKIFKNWAIELKIDHIIGYE